MTPEAAALAVRLLPAALRVARGAAYRRRRPWLADEAESGALLWLVEAAIKYDPARGTDPRPYVLWMVHCRALSFIKWHRIRPTVPLQPPRGACDPEDDPSHNPALLRFDPDPLARVAYDEATAPLPPALKRFADLVCLSGLSVPGAAAREGIPERSGYRVWHDLLRIAGPHLTAPRETT